jgi:hypothetical protein
VIAFLDTSASLTDCQADFGDGVAVGQLLTPLTGFRRRSDLFAIDNGAFAGFDERRFRALLKREWSARAMCRFVAAPDVPFSARRTAEVFSHWYPKLHGWPLAIVAQNGQEDIPIPWQYLDAIFIGGDDEWKDGREAACTIRAALAMGKHVHIGRMNGVARLRKMLEVIPAVAIRRGRVSFDGSGISQYSEMRVKFGKAIRGETDDVPTLYDHREAAA